MKGITTNIKVFSPNARLGIIAGGTHSAYASEYAMHRTGRGPRTLAIYAGIRLCG